MNCLYERISDKKAPIVSTVKPDHQPNLPDVFLYKATIIECLERLKGSFISRPVILKAKIVCEIGSSRYGGSMQNRHMETHEIGTLRAHRIRAVPTQQPWHSNAPRTPGQAPRGTRLITQSASSRHVLRKRRRAGTLSPAVRAGDAAAFLCGVPSMAGSGPGVGRNCTTSVPTNHRFEVITGAERRRRWSEEEKAEIVAESLASETSISAVARRHGLHPNQLFSWRRQFRAMRPTITGCGNGEGGFIPVVVSDTPPTASPIMPGCIDILVGGLTVRVMGPVDASALHGVLDVARRLA